MCLSCLSLSFRLYSFVPISISLLFGSSGLCVCSMFLVDLSPDLCIHPWMSMSGSCHFCWNPLVYDPFDRCFKMVPHTFNAIKSLISEVSTKYYKVLLYLIYIGLFPQRYFVPSWFWLDGITRYIK